MKTTAIVAAVAGLASQAAATSYFSLMAVSSGSPIHMHSIVANSHGLWIGKPTSSYCPANVQKMGGCPKGKGTNFSIGSGQLNMGTAVPGGQKVYVDVDNGAVKYSIAHSADVDGGIVGGWSLSEQAGQDWDVLKNKRGMMACPKGGAYQIFVNVPGLDLSDNCIGPFYAIAKPEGNNKPDAWQYN